MSQTSPLAIVVLISGGGTNLQALIDACQGSFPARIVAVISNRPKAFGLQRAISAGIPVAVLDHTEFEQREQFDGRLMQLIDGYHPELVVLAGFMRILSTGFVHHYQGRLINIHPSLLPLYPGLGTHQQALDNGDSIHGASVHFVTDELDGGPVVLQASVVIEPGDNKETLAARVLPVEHRIYVDVVRWIAEQRLILQNDHAILDGAVLNSPLQLNNL